MSKKSWGVQWVLDQIGKSKPYPPQYQTVKKNFMNKVKVFTCPNCSRVWEKINHPSKMLIYDDFPSFGLEKIICKECEDENAK